MSREDDGIARMQKDLYAKHLGIELLEIKAGYAKAKMPVKENHLNGLGFTHGGAIFSLADLVFAAASNSHGPAAVGLNMNISYLKATGEGELLTATAKEENLTNKTGLYKMEVKDSGNNLVAVAQGIVYRKNY